jgi:hypothetical protein
LGVVGFYRIWVTGFDLTATPLYEAPQSSVEESLKWIGKQQQAFDKLKEFLMLSLGLGTQS